MTPPAALIFSTTRLEILRHLWTGRKSAGELHKGVGSITFGAISQHLKKLRDAGVVVAERKGRSIIYSVERERLGAYAAALDAMWASSLADLKDAAEGEDP